MWVCPLNMHTQLPSGTTGLNILVRAFIYMLTLMCVLAGTGSGETALVSRLFWAINVCICDQIKYPNLMSLLIYCFSHVLDWVFETMDMGCDARKPVFWASDLVIPKLACLVTKTGSAVVECLTRDRGVAGLSLTGVSALCPWARHINPCLLLVQPRKTRPDMQCFR